MNPLCGQTVTVYRMEQGNVSRQVVRNCYYHQSAGETDTLLGAEGQHIFQLICEPGAYTPKIGDRVYPGIGPKQVDWETFLPCTTSGLGEISYVTPWYLQGKLHHFESGRK